MSCAVVWFNKSLSNTWEILAMLRQARCPEEFRVLCTHPRPNYAGRDHADAFEQEPEGLRSAEYVDYCLEMTRRHGIDFFWPGREALAIVQSRWRFEKQGVRVLAAADGEALTLLQSKARVYAALRDDEIRLPEFEVVNDLAGFDAAWARLRPRHPLLCYKPAVSVYGIGFHIVAEHGTALEQWRRGDPMFIRIEDARAALAAKGRFRDTLVMEYLQGPERSVDCLARDGELMRCIVRRKENGGQVLEDHPRLVAAVQRLTGRLRLSNVFNVQFRDSGGVSYLLEINPRMSGGLPFACQSGLVLPYWAIRLAQGTAAPIDLPHPRTGLWVPQPEPVSSL